MKWKTLRGYYFQNFMDEIEQVRNEYMELIKNIQTTKKESFRKEFLNLRKSIEERIAEVDAFLEDNFDKPYVLNFEKGKIKLRKILLITPSDKLNSTTMDKYFKNIDIDLNTLKDIDDDEKYKGETPIYNIVPKEMNKLFNLLDKKEKEEKDNKSNEKYKNKSRNLNFNLSKRKTDYTSFKTFKSFKNKEKTLNHSKNENENNNDNSKKKVMDNHKEKTTTKRKTFKKQDSIISTIKKVIQKPESPKNSFFQPARDAIINTSNKNFFNVENKKIKKEGISNFTINDNNPVSPIQNKKEHNMEFQKEENNFFSNEDEDDTYLSNLIKKTYINDRKSSKFYQIDKEKNSNNNNINLEKELNINNSFKKPKKSLKQNENDNKRISFSPFGEENNSKSLNFKKDFYKYYAEDDSNTNENEIINFSSSSESVSYLDEKEIIIKLILNPKEYGLLLKERAYKTFTITENN